MTLRFPARPFNAALMAASALLLGACVSTEYVGEQIEAAEQRQAGVDSAQNDRISGLDGALAEALERVNQGLAMREPGARLTSAVNSLIIGFGRNSAKVTADDRAKLAELALALLESGEEFHLELQGHTDSSGSPRANAEVGAKRAEGVRLFLHEKGIPLRRMSTISFGDTIPLVTGEGQAATDGNRRVEIIVFK